MPKSLPYSVVCSIPGQELIFFVNISEGFVVYLLLVLESNEILLFFVSVRVYVNIIITFYKIVIADSRRPRDGKFIEKVGYFNPLLPKDKKERLSFDVERIKYWLDKGAKPSFRIARFLGEAKIIPMPEKRNNPLKAKPKKKAQERLKAAEEAKKAPELSLIHI